MGSPGTYYSFKEQNRPFEDVNQKDYYAEFFCTLKYNEPGRASSFIALQGGSRIPISCEIPATVRRGKQFDHGGSERQLGKEGNVSYIEEDSFPVLLLTIEDLRPIPTDPTLQNWSKQDYLEPNGSDLLKKVLPNDNSKSSNSTPITEGADFQGDKTQDNISFEMRTMIEEEGIRSTYVKVLNQQSSPSTPTSNRKSADLTRIDSTNSLHAVEVLTSI
ncbi:hypothetical protein HAX54_002747 [Datura stramonium]|uniref:Uncharacterized protein n=1 Tax=Datura stramonium TaxID=4076 RepID=A0ABS8T504_DATST|nr:hypothetical protein [Datura stramonium]